MSSISIVIPVYNSEKSIGLVVDEIDKVLPSICDNYEVILVNDGSRDHSWDVISKLECSHLYVRAVNLMRNYGQHNALLCGIRFGEV
jgi:undecaprenyl-phosphate 4-deoxy-4-formamido-L-arabinose transferase